MLPLRERRMQPLGRRVTVADVRDLLLAGRVTAVQWERMFAIPADVVNRYRVEIEAARLLTQDAHDAVAAGRLFDFGALPDALFAEVAPRVEPLWARNALAWPYRDPWVFTWLNGQRERSVFLVGLRMEKEVSIGELVPMRMDDELRVVIGDLALLRFPEFGVQLQPSLMRFATDADTVDMAALNRDLSPEEAALAFVVPPLLAVLLILTTRNVGRSTVRADERLQRARVKSGKPRLPPHTVVHTEPYVTAMSAVRTPDHPAGTSSAIARASPRFHLRRGHVRTFGDGWKNVAGQSLFIPDTLVAADVQHRETWKAGRTHYTVR